MGNGVTGSVERKSRNAVTSNQPGAESKNKPSLSRDHSWRFGTLPRSPGVWGKLNSYLPTLGFYFVTKLLKVYAFYNLNSHYKHIQINHHTNVPEVSSEQPPAWCGL